MDFIKSKMNAHWLWAHYLIHMQPSVTYAHNKYM